MSGPPAAGGRGSGAPEVEIILNGAPHRVAAGTTIAELVGELGGSPGGLAVAVDREVVPRSRWGDVVVEGGTTVEVVSAAAGG
jgi:thiamine biosynthesis protein ThiS